MLPRKSWEAYETDLKAVAEFRFAGLEDDLALLQELGLVEGGALTPQGDEYYNACFLRADRDRADRLLRALLLNYKPAEAILQMLSGVPDARRDAAESVLRSQGLGDGLSDREVGSLLMLMNRGGVIKYTKARGSFNVLVKPSAAPEVPKSVFVSPETPYGNRIWLRRILEEPEGFIYWLDKHFMPQALESLWEAADGTRISEIRVLSLKLPDNSGKKALRAYSDLKKELRTRGISFEWRVIPSKAVRATHDRWIIGRASARNVPNVNAIFSGQHSEMSQSESAEELCHVFEAYWDQGRQIDES